eukprot:6182951-Pleurochrysis_carterae.AAC.3
MANDSAHRDAVVNLDPASRRRVQVGKPVGGNVYDRNALEKVRMHCVRDRGIGLDRTRDDAALGFGESCKRGVAHDHLGHERWIGRL